MWILTGITVVLWCLRAKIPTGLTGKWSARNSVQRWGKDTRVTVLHTLQFNPFTSVVSEQRSWSRIDLCTENKILKIMAPKSTVKSGVCLQHYTTIFFFFFFKKWRNFCFYFYFFLLFADSPVPSKRSHSSSDVSCPSRSHSAEHTPRKTSPKRKTWEKVKTVHAIFFLF